MRGERKGGLEQKQVAVQTWQKTLFYSKTFNHLLAMLHTVHPSAMPNTNNDDDHDKLHWF
jgi:hypothetical protein